MRSKFALSRNRTVTEGNTVLMRLRGGCECVLLSPFSRFPPVQFLNAPTDALPSIHPPGRPHHTPCAATPKLRSNARRPLALAPLYIGNPLPATECCHQI